MIYSSSLNNLHRIYLSDFPNFKSHPKEKVQTNFTKNSFELKILDWNKNNYKLSINNLYGEIVPSESSFVQNSSGLVIRLKKLKNETWPSVSKKASQVLLIIYRGC